MIKDQYISNRKRLVGFFLHSAHPVDLTRMLRRFSAEVFTTAQARSTIIAYHLDER